MYLPIPRLSLLALGLLYWAPPCFAQVGHPILVQATDGRVLIGDVDARTDERSLWIRVTSPRLALSVALPWGQVAWAQSENRQYEPAAFVAVARQLASDLPGDFFQQTNEGGPSPVDERGLPGGGRLYHVKPNRQTKRAVTLAAYAHVANWDADAESDGIELTITPRSGGGETIPVDGQLVVELIGRRFAPTRGRPPTSELAEWSQRLRKKDFGDQGAVYRLPFRSWSPHTGHAVSREGLLEILVRGGQCGPLQVAIPVRLY